MSRTVLAPEVIGSARSVAAGATSPSALAPRRRRLIRVVVVLGAYAVLVVEALSAVDALSRWAVVAAWMPWLGVAGSVMFRRRRSLATLAARARKAWGAVVGVDRLGWVILVVLLFAELLVALLAEPNNFDSQTYHLPRIEHWVANGNVEFYPTAIHRQVTLPPGTEYLLLHVRLFTDGDEFYNLIQFGAGLVCLAVGTRIAAQFGGRRRAQLATALLIGTTPMIVLQATSTQTDLVAAAWTACPASLVIDGMRARSGVSDVLLLGATTGLIGLTKTTGLLAAGPLLIVWAVATLRLAPRRRGRFTSAVAATAGASAAILVVACLIAGPYLTRMVTEFGDVLGPPQLRGSIPAQRHDPAAVMLNAVRIGQTALDTPYDPLRLATLAETVGLANALGMDVNDPAITFAQTSFPVAAWYPDEDRVSFPISGTLALIAGAVAIVRPRRVCPQSPTLIRWYAMALVAAGLLYAANVKWQPWGNRLLLFLLVLAVPLAGVGLENASRRALDLSPTGPDRGDRPSVFSACVTVILVSSVLSGYLAVGYGFPRRLVGAGSIFTTSPDETRFLRRPLWLADYRWAADQIRSSGAKRIGIIESNNDWEYPWWSLLGHGRQIVSLTSVLPNHPAPAPETVDAIVCTAPEPVCRSHIPRGWSYHRQATVVVAMER